jgi:hypothetical protein
VKLIDSLTDALNKVEFTEDMARKGELRTMAADLNLSSADATSVSEGLALAQTFKGDEQKTIAARESAVQLLNEEHGEQAALAARAARAFVAKNPPLAQLLERTGAGDSPQVIALVARRALALHAAGKLTIPGTADKRATDKPPLTTAEAFYPRSQR